MDITNIDWSIVCNHLRARYKPLSTIGKEIGSDWQHLNRLARGEVVQPRINVGIKLLDLHFDYCRDRHNASIMRASL